MDSKILSALIGAAVAAISIISKDYFLEIIKENRHAKQTKYHTFKLYANPIIKSTESLCWRLKEIFEQRGAFLMENEPRNEFFEYKYVSTNYRLGVLIGWIRAINREFAYIETTESDGNIEIEHAFLEFQKSLADGQHMELSILKELCNCWHISLSNLSTEGQAKLAVKVEEIVFNMTKDKKTIHANKLPDPEQIQLLQKIADSICQTVKCTKINNAVITETKSRAINEISRIEIWIYRDWQNAIGDLMLKNIEHASRRYDLIGYGEFEDLFYSENKWILRLKRLFNNLNVEIDDRFDARVGQLKRLYKASIKILVAFNQFNEKQETIPIESINNLSDFCKKI